MNSSGLAWTLPKYTNAERLGSLALVAISMAQAVIQVRTKPIKRV